jgi:hypothetical protein
VARGRAASPAESGTPDGIARCGGAILLAQAGPSPKLHSIPALPMLRTSTARFASGAPARPANGAGAERPERSAQFRAETLDALAGFLEQLV